MESRGGAKKRVARSSSKEAPSTTAFSRGSGVQPIMRARAKTKLNFTASEAVADGLQSLALESLDPGPKARRIPPHTVEAH